jgi:hypothetical protein
MRREVEEGERAGALRIRRSPATLSTIGVYRLWVSAEPGKKWE